MSEWPKFDFQLLENLHNRCGEWDSDTEDEKKIYGFMKTFDLSRNSAILYLETSQKIQELNIIFQLPDIDIQL